MKKYLLVLSLNCIVLLSFAQIEEEIDALFGHLENQPGVAVGIFKNGEITFSKEYGLANLDYDIPITSKTVFDVGSVAKQFTATCIFLLEQQGKLSIDDPIQRYLPEMPVFHEERVTIRHLLNHNSGLRDYVEITSYAGIPFENIFTEEMGLDIMARQKERSFPPGKQFMYNNGGYLLLAIIVRRVSGESIGNFAQKHIFEPLGMKNTFILENPNRIVKNTATGYVRLADGRYEKKHFYNIALGGDGQVYTTVEDLLHWDNNFYSKQVGGQTLFDRQHERGILNNGDTLDYAGGLFIQERQGHRAVQHTGAWGGFRAVIYRFPDLHTSVVMLANCPDAAPISTILKLVDLVLPEQKEQKKSNETASSYKIASKKLASFTGTFEVIGQPQLRFESALKNDTLRIIQLWDKLTFDLIPTAANAFFRKDFPMVRFTFDAKKGVPTVHERLEIWQTQRVESADLTKLPNLQDYIGTYYSEEVGVAYSIEIENNQLLVIRNKKKIATLSPVSKDVFGNCMQGFEFKRTEGKITGLLIQDRRIRNLAFEKLEGGQ